MSFSDNMNLTNGFAEVLGDRFRGVSVRAYQYDLWVQDEIEFGTLTSPDHRVDMVIDSIRSGNGRGLDDLPENEFEAPDFARQTWGNERPSSQDSFGNLEVSPPVTVDGVTYPFGRIYWGEVRGDGPRDQALLDMLTAQQVQAPFQLDVSFLCVGHVDEFSTFLPDPTAPSGHRLYVTDTALAWEMLEGLDPDMSLPLYGSDKGYSTVQDILDDSVLRALNEEVQLDYLDPNVEIFKAELGLTDEDIVYLPMLFEEVRNCGGATAAFFPGTVNMQVSTLPGESTTHVFMPDPFFRSDTSISAAALATDPLIAFVEALLPANVEPHWLDDWDWYHLALGEVHCGSNTVRTPAEAPWWESAMHLIGGDQ
jgi:protein-arginine deiminase